MPQIVILAGPNGAGKTTASAHLLRDRLGVMEFVNADAIAAGLSPFDPAGVALEAGRIMLGRLNRLAEQRRDFAFETTLAARTYRPWLLERFAEGYEAALFFMWLPSPEFAIRRVAGRVQLGGHAIDAQVIRDRYARGLRNFFQLYRPILSQWSFYNSATATGPLLIAEGDLFHLTVVHDGPLWHIITAEYDNAPSK